MLKQLWYYGAVPVREVAMIVALAFASGAVAGFCFGRAFELIGR